MKFMEKKIVLKSCNLSKYPDLEIVCKVIENNLINGSLDIKDLNIATTGDEIENTSFEPFTIRICFEWY